MESNEFADGTPTAWVVRCWPPLKADGDLLSETIYAWQGDPPSCAAALSADLIAVCTTSGGLLLLKRDAEPAASWQARWERTNLPLPSSGVRALEGGQGAGIFVIAWGCRRFVHDVRGAVARMGKG